MKKIASLVTVAMLMLCLFAGCGNTDDSNAPSESAANVGDILDAPEKTVSLKDVNDLTIACQIEQLQTKRTTAMTIAMRRRGDSVTTYNKSVITDGLAEQTYTTETLSCGNETDGITYHLYNGQWDAGAADTYAQEYEYCLSKFADYGYDYATPSIYQYGSFVKCADETVGQWDCYVYDTELIETINGEAITYSLKIWVDKASGIWVKSTGARGETAVFSATLLSVEQNSLLIPGMDAVDMEEQVIYDKNNVTITAKSLSFTNPNYAAELTLDVKNNNDSDIKISSTVFEVNDLFLGQSVVSGTVTAKATSDIVVNIPNKAIQQSNITQIQTMMMRLVIETCHSETSFEGTYTITDDTLDANTGDLTIVTKCPDSYVQQVNTDGTLLFDENGVKFTVQQFTITDSGDAFLKAYCENTYTDAVRVQISFKKINGKEVEDSGRASVAAQTRGYTGFYLWKDDLAEYGVSGPIESAEVSYTVFTGEAYSGETLIEKSAPITLTFA